MLSILAGRVVCSVLFPAPFSWCVQGMVGSMRGDTPKPWGSPHSAGTQPRARRGQTLRWTLCQQPHSVERLRALYKV